MEDPMNITINTKKKITEISPMLYGIFFEDINYGGDGGLYGELLPNRSFEYYDRDNNIAKHKMCWKKIGNVDFQIKKENPINDVHKHYAFLSGMAGSGIKNIGFCEEGFAVDYRMTFNFSCYAMADEPIKLLVRAVDKEGKIYGQSEIEVRSNSWVKYETVLTTLEKCKHAYLEILLKHDGHVNLEFISLFSKNTYKNRKNGLRSDLVEKLKELSPKFMRFPGGCIVEGRSFENMYNWKDTIGKIEERKTNWNRWQMEEYQQEGRKSEDYFQSYGLGYYEYFLLCEDLNAKPVPVMNAGMTCQWHEGLLVELEDLDKWIQDIFDLIEFANGDENTVWGKKRVEMGHEKPFDLEYIAIGNEQWGMEYFERYEVFEKEIKAKYPDIKLITSAGWTVKGKDYDFAIEWLKSNKDKAYAVDEHFYKSPDWFIKNVNRYDKCDRTMPKILIGEYAAHTSDEVKSRRNNWYVALAEAALLTGVEKNSDHVVMTCYAPLFAKSDHQQWQPNLIWFDNHSVYGTPSFYVQKLFSNYIGDYIVETSSDDSELYVSTSISNNEKELYIKIVNISDENKEAKINIGQSGIYCEAIELSGEFDMENSHALPEMVYPVTRMICLDEEYFIKKHSITILKISLT